MITKEEEENGVDAKANVGSVENNNELEHEPKDPLKNPLIIDYVFNLLDLADIKQCRLVCSQWNEISIPFIEKMALVTIGCQYLVKPDNDQFLNKFNAVAAKSAVAFRSFKLNRYPGLKSVWSVSVLEEFFKKQNVEELTINEMTFYFPRSRIILFVIDRFIHKNLTYLVIRNSDIFNHHFLISIQKLETVKFLSLNCCRLDIVEDFKLAPVKFEMAGVVVAKDGDLVKNLFVNDILSFENLKDLKICDGTMGSSDLSINLDSNVKVDNLFLEGVTVQNFTESTWKVNKKLTLRRIPFESSTQIQYTELDFGASTLDFEALSDSLEKLTLDTTEGRMHIFCSPLFTLPNLKHFELLTEAKFCQYCPHSDDDADDPLPLPLRILGLFGECSNLSTVKLESKSLELTCTLETDWIPPSVTNIFLVGNIRVSGNIFNMEKVVIQNNKLENIKEILDRLKSEHLVLDLESFSVSKVQEILLLITEMPYKSVAIGSLSVNMPDLENSGIGISDAIDGKAPYYYFYENKIGRAISEYEYKRKLKQH